MNRQLRIVPAGPEDVPTVLRMIRGLAEYEKLAHLVTATEASLREALFGAHPWAEAAIGYVGEDAAGVAVYFHTFSTFAAARGMFLEDLYVEPAFRGQGLGKELIAYVAGLAVERLPAIGVGGARLERAGYRLLSGPGRAATRRVEDVPAQRRAARAAGRRADDLNCRPISADRYLRR